MTENETGNHTVNQTGSVEDPDTDFTFGQDVIGPLPDAPLETFIDFFALFLHVYLVTTMTFLIAIFLFYVVIYLFGSKYPVQYGTRMQYIRTRRVGFGILAMTMFLPILYMIMWISTGSQTPGGRGLPSDGVFGTSFEEWIVGGVADPDTRISNVEDIVGDLSVEFAAVLDSIGLFARAYLMTTGTLLVIFLIIFVVATAVGKTQQIAGRFFLAKTFRTAVGLVLLTFFFPVIYLMTWVISGGRSESPDEIYEFESDGVFGTSFEDFFLGPDPGSGGFEQMVAFFGRILEAYQVTLSLFLLTIVVFLVVVYATFKWPDAIGAQNKLENVYRSLFAFVAVLAFIPIMHLIGWVAVGVYRPDESFTRVAPEVELPYDTVFGNRQHPFFESLSNNPDPIAAVISSVIELQLAGLMTVGLVAIISGAVVYTVVNHTSVVKGEYGIQFFRGGAILVIVVLFTPGILTTAAFVATGDGDFGVWGSYSHELGAQCQDFEAGELGDWEVTEGTVEMASDPWGVQIDGNMEQQLPEIQHGDRYASFSISSIDRELDVHFYDDGQRVLSETITDDASFAHEIDGDFRVVMESNETAIVDRTCVGVDVGSDPQIAMAQQDFDEDGPIVLRDGTYSNATIYNVGETHSVDAFDIGYTINGTGPHGEWRNSTQLEPVSSMAGGRFVNIERDITEAMHGAQAVGEVELVTLADPYDELSERTTVPNRDIQTIEIEYAHLIANLDVEKTSPNSSRFDMVTENDGTFYSESTTVDVTITEDGEIAYDGEYSGSVPEIDAQDEYVHPSIDHVFRTPGHYEIEKDVNVELLAMDSVDTETITFIDSDLRGDVTDVSDEVRVGNAEQFTVNVTNKGNEEYEGDTEAVVELVHESGEVEDEIVYDVPPLDVDESDTRELSFTPINTGEHEVRIDVQDKYWPYESTDSETFVAVGPSLTVDLTANDVLEFEETDISATILNDGDDFVEETDYTATLVHPDGTVLNESTQGVPSLDEGETYETDILVDQVDDTGDYDVEIDVNGTELASGDVDEDVFEVLFTQIDYEIESEPVDGEDAVDVIVTAFNNGTTETDGGHEFQFEIVNQETGETTTGSVTFGSIPSDDSRTQVTRVQLEDGGDHVIKHPGDDEDDDDDEFEHTWPDVSGQIEAIDNPVFGTDGDVQTEVTNVGSEESPETTATVTVIDDFAQVREEFTYQVPELSVDESDTVEHMIEYPEPGNYVAQIDVDEFNVEENSTDSTGIIDVRFADLEIDVDPQQDYYTPEEDVDIDVTIINDGNEDSEADDVRTVFEDESDDVVAQSFDGVGTIQPGEQETVTATVDIIDTGEYDVISEFDPAEYEEISDSDIIRVEEPSLQLELDAEDIFVDQEPDAVATIINNQGVDSEETEFDATLYDESGSVLSEVSRDVGSLSSGEEQTIELFDGELDETGEYDVEAELAGDNTDEEEEESFFVQIRSLDVQVNANNVFVGEKADTEVVLTNNQDVEAPESTLTADMVFEEEVVEDVEYDIPALGPGEQHRVDLFESDLDDIGEYEVDTTLERDDTILDDQLNTFDVVFWDLKGELDVQDFDTTPEAHFDIVVPNEGDGESNPTTADVVLEAPNGSVIYDEEVDIPEIAGGSEYVEQIDFMAPEDGEYTASIDVDDESNPEGTTDEASFDVSWPMYAAYISSEDEVEGNTAEFDVQIINYGSAPTTGGDAYVDIYDDFGNEVETYVVDVPTIESGGGYTTTVSHQFLTPGEYDARILADEGAYNLAYGWLSDGEEGPEDDDSINDDDGDYEDDDGDDHLDDDPQGPGDDPAEPPDDGDDGIVIVHGNLVTEVEFINEEAEVSENSFIRLIVENRGNAPSEGTVADVEVIDRDGNAQFLEDVEVDSLDVDESQEFEFATEMETPGDATVYSDVDFEVFPVGNTDSDTIYVQSPDLQVDIDVEDTRLGEETDVRVEIENVGEIESSSSTLELFMYNADGDQVVEEYFEVNRVTADDTAVVEHTQLIAVECWRTEMSCEPGAEMNPGEYLAVGSLDGIEFNVEGTEDTDNFYVEEEDG